MVQEFLNAKAMAPPRSENKGKVGHRKIYRTKSVAQRGFTFKGSNSIQRDHACLTSHLPLGGDRLPCTYGEHYQHRMIAVRLLTLLLRHYPSIQGCAAESEAQLYLIAKIAGFWKVFAEFVYQLNTLVISMILRQYNLIPGYHDCQSFVHSLDLHITYLIRGVPIQISMKRLFCQY